MKQSTFVTVLTAVAALLTIPLLAMQFTDEVDWTAGDFLVMGVLLLVTGLVVGAVRDRVSRPSYRIGLIAVAVGVFLLLWAELAVGVFGSPLAGS